MMDAAPEEQGQATGGSPAPTDKSEITSRIERARRQLAPATTQGPSSDSRWQNWYSR